MSVNVGNLHASLDLDTNGFHVAVRRAGQVLREFKGQMDGVSGSARHAEVAIHSMGRSFRETILTLGALRFLMMDIDDVFLRLPKSVAKSTGEFERLQVLFEGLSKSSDEMTRKMEGFQSLQSAIQLAQNSPFDVTAITDAFVKFKTGGLDPANGSLKALVDGVAKAGGSSEVLKRASVAIQQMAGKGVISMEELRQQLGEAVPNAMQLMADGMGITMQELTKQVSKGSVEARHALAKMFAQMALDANGAAEKMLNTLPGSIDRLKTEFELFKKAIGDQGFTTALTQAAKGLTEFFQSAEGQQLSRDIGVALRDITQSLVALSKWVYDNAEALKYLFSTIFSLYGGAKMFGFVEGVNQLYKRNQELVAETAEKNRAAIQKEIDKLREKNRAYSQGMRENEAARRAAASGAESVYAGEIAKQQQIIENAKKAQAADVARLEQLIGLEKKLDDQRQRMMSSGRSALTSSGMKPVVDPAQYEEVRKMSVAYSAEADAISRRQAVHEKAIETARREMQLAQQRRQVGMNNAAMYARTTEEYKRQVGAINQQIAAQNALMTAAGRAASGIAGFAKSMFLNVGYAVAFAAVIYTLTKAFEAMSAAARKAEADAARAVRAKNNQGTKQDLEDADKDIEARQKKIRELQRAIDTYSNVPVTDPATRKMVPGRESQNFKNLVEQLNRENTQLERAIGERQKIAETVDRSDRLNAVSSLMAKYEEDWKDALSKTGMVDDKLKLVGDKNIKARRDLGEKMVRAEVDFWANLLAKRKAEIGKVGNAQDDAELNSIKERLISAQEQMRLVTEDGPVMGGGGPGSKGSKLTRSPIDEFIQRQQEEMHITAAKMDQYMQDTVRVADIYEEARRYINERVANGELDDLSNGKKVKPTSEKVREAIEAMAGNKLQQLGNGEVKKLREFLDGLEPEYDRMLAIFNGGDGTGAGPTPAEEKFQALTKEVLRFREVLEKRGFNVNEFLALGSVEVAKDRYIRALSEIAEKNRQLYDEVDTDQRAVLTRRADREIQAAQNRFEAEKRAIEQSLKAESDKVAEIAALEDQLATYIYLRRTKLEQELRTPMTQTLDTWRNGMKAMEEASARWADSFVDTFIDGIAKGKIEWSSLVKQVLSDIVKMQYRQLLGNAIGNDQADGMVGSLGSMLGLGNGKPMMGPPGELAGGGARGSSPALPVFTKDASSVASDLDPTKLAEQQTGILDKIKDTMGGVWESLKEGFGAIGSAFMEGLNSLMSALMSSGGGEGGWMEGIASLFSSWAGGGATASAKGNIMDFRGPRKLKSYGVSKRAAAGTWSEGDKPEAIIPLPDGRAVPVAMTGGGGAQVVPAPVSVNVINQSGTPVNAKMGNTRFDGRQMILDVVMEAMNTPGQFRDGVRAATSR